MWEIFLDEVDVHLLGVNIFVFYKWVDIVNVHKCVECNIFTVLVIAFK